MDDIPSYPAVQGLGFSGMAETSGCGVEGLK